MKYIVKPAIRAYGKYIGENTAKIGLAAGVKYELYEVSVTRDGNMYVRVVIPVFERTVSISSAISASKFEFTDEYGFKYEPPFRKGMTFRYEYDPYHREDGSGTIYIMPYAVVKYAYNKESCDLEYVLYPVVGNDDSIELMVPLFEGSFEYTSGDIQSIIKSRISTVKSNTVDDANKTITYRLNNKTIATMKRTNGIYEFTRFWVNETTSEVSAFTLSKFKNDFIIFVTNPSKYIDEKPGFCEARLNIIKK